MLAKLRLAYCRELLKNIFKVVNQQTFNICIMLTLPFSYIQLNFRRSNVKVTYTCSALL